MVLTNRGLLLGALDPADARQCDLIPRRDYEIMHAEG